eukprot:scaffold28101_cov67-Phaeocystis_antarctica.AAC.2
MTRRRYLSTWLQRRVAGEGPLSAVSTVPSLDMQGWELKGLDPLLRSRAHTIHSDCHCHGLVNGEGQIRHACPAI